MSIRAAEWAARADCPDAISKAVLLHFAIFHNQKTGQCNPSNAVMLARTQFDARTLKSAIRRLEKCGLLGFIGSKKGGRAKSIMRVLNAPESAGVTTFIPAKGGKCVTPFCDVKGGIRQTPFNIRHKGVHICTPEKGRRERIGKDPSQEVRISGDQS